MENDSTNLFLNAAQKLDQANKELFKPEEDIVSYLVCKNSQYAIENYLKGYLLKNDVATTEKETIESLFKKCKKINKNFKKVSLTGIDCKAHDLDSRYCTEVSKINNCFDVADNLDTFLRKEKII